MDINVFKVINVMLKKWWIIILSALVCAVIAFSYSYFAIEPLYRSSTSLYVNNSDVSIDKINASDITAAESLVGSYIHILQSRGVLSDVVEDMNNKYTYSQIKQMVEASSKTGTVIIEITVMCPIAEDAQTIANLVVKNGISAIQRIITSTGAEIIDEAPEPESTSYPNYQTFLILGFLVGAFIAVAIIFVLEMIDTRIKTEDDFTDEFKEIPVLGIIPRIEV